MWTWKYDFWSELLNKLELHYLCLSLICDGFPFKGVKHGHEMSQEYIYMYFGTSGICLFSEHLGPHTPPNTCLYKTSQLVCEIHRQTWCTQMDESICQCHRYSKIYSCSLLTALLCIFCLSCHVALVPVTCILTDSVRGGGLRLVNVAHCQILMKINYWRRYRNTKY